MTDRLCDCTLPWRHCARWQHPASGDRVHCSTDCTFDRTVEICADCGGSGLEPVRQLKGAQARPCTACGTTGRVYGAVQ